MKLPIVAIATLLTVNSVHANMIRSLWDSIKSQDDLTTKHDGLRKVHVTPNFYFYKLTPKTQPVVEQTNSIPYDHEAIAEALKHQNSKHPDNVPSVSTIDSKPESQAIDSIAVRNDKQTIYGDSSPLKDHAVIAAWEEADRAKARLEAHRKYMERVRQSRKNVQQSKTVSSANQTSGELK